MPIYGCFKHFYGQFSVLYFGVFPGHIHDRAVAREQSRSAGKFRLVRELRIPGRVDRSRDQAGLRTRDEPRVDVNRREDGTGL